MEWCGKQPEKNALVDGQGKIKFPVSLEIVKRFLITRAKGQMSGKQHVSMYSSDYLQGHVSAISWLWRQECPKQMATSDFDAGIKAFVTRVARRQAEARISGGAPLALSYSHKLRLI